MAKPVVSPTLMLGVGVLAISVSAILIRFAQAGQTPSLVIAAWRMVMAAAVLWPLALWRRRDELKRVDSAEMPLALLAGVMLAAHFAAWITSLAYTSVATSTVLVNTSPLWVALASPFLLKEPVGRPAKIGVGLVLLGSLLISLADLGGGRAPLIGNLLALVGALTGSGYFLIGRRLRPHLSALTYTSLVYGIAAALLTGLCLATGQRLWGYPPQTYLLFALMALIPQLLGHSSFNYALGFLPAAYVMVAVVSEPIGASLLALLLLAEVPSRLTVLGGAVILGGIIVAGRR